MEYFFGNEKNDRNQYEKILRIRAFHDFAFFSHYLVNVVLHLYLFSHQLEKKYLKTHDRNECKQISYTIFGIPLAMLVFFFQI